jgi:hypothetical protein
MDRDRLLSAVGWINSCLLLIDCRLPVRAGFGKAGSMKRPIAVL